jgi:hypothetical protein
MATFGAGPGSECRPRFERVKDAWANPKTWRRFHSTATGVWFLAIIPTVLWWPDSVLWVGLISCYANAVGHFSAWQGSRAEDNNSTNTSD